MLNSLSNKYYLELVSDWSLQKQLRSKREVLITHSMLRFSSHSPPERIMTQLVIPGKFFPKLGNENVRSSRFLVFFLVLPHMDHCDSAS